MNIFTGHLEIEHNDEVDDFLKNDFNRKIAISIHCLKMLSHTFDLRYIIDDYIRCWLSYKENSYRFLPVIKYIANNENISSFFIKLYDLNLIKNSLENDQIIKLNRMIDEGRQLFFEINSLLNSNY
jgi:hypothetical protein